MFKESLNEVSFAILLHKSYRNYPSRRRACFLNMSELRQNLIGTIIRVIVLNLRPQSEIGNHERDQRVSVQPESSVCVCGVGIKPKFHLFILMAPLIKY